MGERQRGWPLEARARFALVVHALLSRVGRGGGSCPGKGLMLRNHL